MQFLIADTFTESLARLTAQEQKSVKTTAFDLQMDPSAPGLSFHRLDRVRDPNFWSVRVNADIRLIVHRTQGSLLLAYVGHHDDAYAWAERRRIEQHPSTGAMQLVEVRERIEDVEIVRPRPALEADTSPPRIPRPAIALFADRSEGELLAIGVPKDWVADVRQATEDTLFDIAAHLPQEAQEALLRLAVGERPEPPKATPTDPFAHPDAQRRFRLVANRAELEQALAASWEKWVVFLHPDQREYVEREWTGPARISGSAGTGKTVVALHRAAYLARKHAKSRVLLTTFTKALANALKQKLRVLVQDTPELLSRINVQPLSALAHDIYTSAFGQPNLAPLSLIQSLLKEAASQETEHKFSMPFLMAEWQEVVDPWQLEAWEAYRDVARLGRKTRIGSKQREALWRIFQSVRSGLAARKSTTWAGLFSRAAKYMAEQSARPFDFAIVDEAQDLGVAEARFLTALVPPKGESLFFAGDLGQRIFQHPFSWRALGIDVRGRAVTLRINYRTSHEIRSRADRLLPASLSDIDGLTEERRGTISAFNGPAPEVVILESNEEERDTIAFWIAERMKEGIRPHEVGVIVRSAGQMARARAAAKQAKAAFVELNDKVEGEEEKLALCTMHLAKGLEFRAVAVMACDDEIIPLQDRIETVSDESDLEEVYNTERHLLYVACTRARDRLLVTGVKPASEFLSDIIKAD